MRRIGSITKTVGRFNRFGHAQGLTLPEVLAAIIIAAAVLTVVVSVHSRVQQSAEAIEGDLARFSLPQEILQLIAEDLDSKVVPKVDATADAQANTRIQLYNRIEDGFSIAQLVITTTIKDEQWQDKVLEEVIWQANVDPFSDRIVLYRSHSGVIQEDKLLDQKRDIVEKFYPFIPVSGGLSVFRVEAKIGENWLTQWSSSALPTGIRVTLSDAEPHNTVQDQWEVDEDKLVVRTIAIDRTRKIQFIVPDPNVMLEEDANVL